MEEGFYWAKWADAEEWEIAEKCDSVWYRTGTDITFGWGENPGPEEIAERLTR